MCFFNKQKTVEELVAENSRWMYHTDPISAPAPSIGSHVWKAIFPQQ
jgi:hypothetical protein